MTTSFVARGTDLIKEAVKKDNEEDFEAALHLYSRGIEFLITGLKYEKNARVVDAIRTKVNKYLERAENIQKFVQSKEYKKNRNRRKPEKIGQKSHGGTGNPEDSDSDDDAETKKLKGAISQAIIIEKPNVRWDDVAGLSVAKQLLKEAVILPIRFPHIFTGKRKPWEGILLYGPPGTGKSYLAKAVATEANNSTFFSVSSSDLVSKYVGESERLVKNLFELARERKPSIIFIDEIDSLATSRNDNEQDSGRRLKTEFMVQLQGVGKSTRGVLTLGATNCPWDLDPAIRRRFAKRIYIPLPDKEARRVMFKVHIGDTPNSLTHNDLIILAQKTPGFSGSDIAGIVQDALMEPVRTMIRASHFKKVFIKNNQKNKNKNININKNEQKMDDIHSINDDGNEQKQNINDNNNNNNDGNWYWMPCSPNDPNGKEMNLMQIPSSEQSHVRAEDLKLGHFLRILQDAKPSVGKEDIAKHEAWTKQYGQEGT